MKVLLVNGSPHKEGCTYTALREVADSLEREGIGTEILHLGTKPLAGCIDCCSCYRTGKCFVNDIVNEVAARMVDEFDGLVVGSPVYYAGPDSQILAFLDRLFFSSGSRFAGRVGAAVVSCRRAGSTASFDCLNKYFTISNMPIVSSQYWNQIHGNTAEQARQDAEGLQTMRRLGKNMAWLLKCIELGRKNGLPFPELGEKQIFTNFIR